MPIAGANNRCDSESVQNLGSPLMGLALRSVSGGRFQKLRQVAPSRQILRRVDLASSYRRYGEMAPGFAWGLRGGLPRGTPWAHRTRTEPLVLDACRVFRTLQCHRLPLKETPCRAPKALADPRERNDVLEEQLYRDCVMSLNESFVLIHTTRSLTILEHEPTSSKPRTNRNRRAWQ